MPHPEIVFGVLSDKKKRREDPCRKTECDESLHLTNKMIAHKIVCYLSDVDIVRT